MGWCEGKCKYCGNKVSWYGSWDMPLDLVCADCAKNKK